MSYEGRALTKRMTTSAAVKAVCGTIWDIVVEPGAAAGTVIVKDGGASGTEMASFVIPASPGTSYPVRLAAGIHCNTSVYVVVTNCVAVVSYT